VNEPTQRRVAKVRAPATTSNLGPGFDALGLALGLWNSFEIEETATPGVRIEATGPGADRIPRDDSSLVARAFRATRERIGLPPPVGLAIRIEVAVPLGSGLGSSATATVAGVLAADALAGRVLEERWLAEVATAVEGHPDNVTPCLVGGLVTCAIADDGRLEYLSVVPPRAPSVVVATPLHFELSTEKMRSVLPQAVAYRDAVRNVQRTALLVAALLEGERAVLARAMEDRLHEPYRAPLVPGFDAVKAAARGAGALGVALSGSGPSVLAFADDEADAVAVGKAMVAAWDAHGIDAVARALPVDAEGARVVLDPPEPERKRARTSRLRPG
jgi:homoserine kinase